MLKRHKSRNSQQTGLTDVPKFVLLFALLIGLMACADVPIGTYTTKKVPELPCEKTQRFFLPIEFNGEGDVLYEDQIQDLIQILSLRPTRDVYVFVHGWDKTVMLAEKDYSDFICRFHQTGNTMIPSNESEKPSTNDALMVGLFWPSTSFPDSTDSLFLKPLTYSKIPPTG